PLYETRRQGLFHRVYPGSGITRANRNEPHAFDVSAGASGGLRRNAGRAGFGGGVRRVRLRSDGGEIWPGSRRFLPGELAQTALRRFPRRLRSGEALNRSGNEAGNLSGTERSYSISSIHAIWIASRIFSLQCFGSSSNSSSPCTHSKRSVKRTVSGSVTAGRGTSYGRTEIRIISL